MLLWTYTESDESRVDWLDTNMNWCNFGGRRCKMHIDLDQVDFVTETALTIRQSRRRTTVPKEIVDRLGLTPEDRLRWVLLTDGTVIVTRVRRLTEGNS